MFGYHTPGVYYEWGDTPATVGLRRTDIAGFVGIAARGPLHTPVKVESWTQFASVFGGHQPQAYLAYAVQGFFANGGRTCWVVRVADPHLARPAWLDLLDSDGRPRLRIVASSPGTWGQDIHVSVKRGDSEHFSLTLALPDGSQEVWRNLTIYPPHLDLLDSAGQKALRLVACGPDGWQQDIRVKIKPCAGDQSSFSLELRAADGIQEKWEYLSMAYVEKVLNDPERGSNLVRARDLHGPQTYTRGEVPNLKAGDGLLKANPNFVGTALNKAQTGSKLVSVCCLHRPTDFPMTLPSTRIPNMVQDLLDTNGSKTLRVRAKGPEMWQQDIKVKVEPSEEDVAFFSLELRAADGIREKWEDLSMDPHAPRYVEKVLNDPKRGSELVVVHSLGSLSASAAQRRPKVQKGSLLREPWCLIDGGDGLKALKPRHFMGSEEPWGLATLEAIDEVNVVAMPDIMTKSHSTPPPSSPRLRCEVFDDEPSFTTPQALASAVEFPPDFNGEEVRELQKNLLQHCEKLKDRLAILVYPDAEVKPEQVIKWRNEFDTSYAALYYPWLSVPDPLRLEGLLRTIPPDGHIAGAYARGDLLEGVHTPPANIVLEAVEDVTAHVGDIDHGMFNDHAVNIIRAYSGRGIRIAGARTLSQESAWRYINVRRLFIMIEEALAEQLQWTVFEPNSRKLHYDIGRVVRGYLDRLWQRGMLDGATPEEAYHVRCDETTTPPEEADRGRLICEIGARPPWPAEFVVVRIGVTDRGTEILE